MTDTPPWATFAERAVYLPDADAVVVADVHVGRDAASDVSLPLGEREDLVARLSGLLDRFDPETVVVAGDLLHVHGSVPDGVLETVEGFVHAVEDVDASLRVVRGNHDTMLDAVDGELDDTGEQGSDGKFDDEHVELDDDYVKLADGTVVCHGDDDPPVDAPRYVVGHQHPTVEIEGQRHPCFLYGPNQHADSDVLVLPTFTRLAPGTLVNRLTDGAAVSPLLDQPSGYRPIVVSDGEALGFPALGDLRGLL